MSKLRRFLATLALSAVLSGTLVGTANATAAAPDGSAADKAAPSCWAIKQSYPASANGVYWLQTSTLVTPQQFYCDQTTAGGGWVLVGRGREGWNFIYGGQRTPGAVRNTPTGTAAFPPAALPGDTINGLLDGTRVDALPDGVRLVRATNSSGTTWQEIRWKFKSLPSWSWTFDGNPPHNLNSVTVGSTVYSGGNTRDWSGGTTRIFTFDWANHGYLRGFSHGSFVTGGSNSSTNYLWQNGTEGNPIPFTQVYIRPMLTSSTFPAIADTGTPASTKPPVVSNATAPQPWGVTGVVGGGVGEENLEVQGIGFLGDTAYVGGRFQYVQKGATPAPADKIEQSYLAAFDVNTGEWRSTFRPTLNGQVWDIQTAGDKVIIAGEFTSVNGEPNTAGVAALDPVTGAVVPNWRATFTRAGSTLKVKALDLQGDWIYVGGGFDHVTGGNPLFGPVWVGGATRLRLSDGRPDENWTPFFDATVTELDASPNGDRVYFGGRFSNVGSEPANSFAAITTATPAVKVSGLGDWLPSTARADGDYRQAVKEVGDKVWMGGSEHDFQVYTRDTLTRISGNITKSGGDFQAAAVSNGIIYGSCHCENYVYNDASSWDNLNSWSNIHQISWIGAWNAQTGEYMKNFAPSIASRRGDGPWALEFDPNGCLWFGGDMNRGSWDSAAGAYQWLGGFGRLCPPDSTAPTAPTNLRLTGTNGGNQLAWNAATDDSGSVSYEVLRGDRVIATVGGTTYTDASASGTQKYWVRAVDATGNRSASTPSLLVEATDTLLAANATWKWRYDGTDLGTAWSQVGFDDSAWASGPAELGYGDGDEATLLPAGSTPRYVTAYFRSTVNVANPAAYNSLLLDLVRDDGAVVYINGTEVGRDNLPAGPIAYTQLANVGYSTRTEETTPVRFTVPATALVAGTNTIAVEMHQYDQWSGDLSFSLKISATLAQQ